MGEVMAIRERDPFLGRALELVAGDAPAPTARSPRKSNSNRSRRRIARAVRRGSTVAKRRKRQIEAERARRRARGGKTRRQVAEELLKPKQRRRGVARDRNTIHPTQKPIELPARAIGNSCPVGGVVYEPFCGSGSTLIAAERLGRRCMAMEMDPSFCDAIVNRWQGESGQQAVREEAAP